MKTVLLLSVGLLMTTSVARADDIGVFSDGIGASCSLAPGFTSTATVVHKFTIGARASRFSLEFPPGSSFFSFVSAFSQGIPVQSYEGIAIDYGECMQGSFAVGTIVAILATGTLWVTPADGFSQVIVTDCALVEKAACGGATSVGWIGSCGCPTPTDQKTWGAVKALYRE